MKRVDKPQHTMISVEYRATNLFWSKISKKLRHEDNRIRANVIIRHSFFVAARQLTSLSLSEIASILNRDHASVIHAIKNHDSNLKYLPHYANVFSDIVKGLKSMLSYEADVYSASNIDKISDLRLRLIDLSQKLRIKIKELNDFKRLKVNMPEKIERKNRILINHNQDLKSRITNLENEIRRLKKLI
jgi:hypothetical protein